MAEWDDVERLATQGKKIQAIKGFRELTRAGLKESKEAVEWFQRNGHWPGRYARDDATPPPREEPPSADDPLTEVERWVAQGRKINAIKDLRALTGWGLKESKQVVEQYMASTHWPPALLQTVGRLSRPAPEPPPVVSSRRPEIEQFMAKGRKINAIKVLREVTGWGLRQSKDAVDHYQARGHWRPDVLAALGEAPDAASSSAPPPSSVGAPSSGTIASTAPSGSASGSGDPERDQMLAALAQHLGRAPNVRLAVRAQRVPYEGFLVMLDDRACFFRNDRGHYVIDPVVPVFWYGEITEVDFDTSLGTDLHISMGHVHEWLSGIDPQDAEAAVALFRVLAP